MTPADAGRAEGRPTPDLGIVDALARLQLEAHRLGWSVRVSEPVAELRELVDLSGLSELLLEPRRETEGGEQLGVEEVVERGDPPA